jgi:hypothetical protein
MLQVEDDCLLGCCAKVIALMMEAAGTSETSVNFYQTIGTTTQKKAIVILAAVRT